MNLPELNENDDNTRSSCIEVKTAQPLFATLEGSTFDNSLSPTNLPPNNIMKRVMSNDYIDEAD